MSTNRLRTIVGSEAIAQAASGITCGFLALPWRGGANHQQLLRVAMEQAQAQVAAKRRHRRMFRLALLEVAN